MSGIINAKNDLIDLSLKKLNANELDIFLALCYKCQRQGLKEISVSFDELKRLSKYRGKNNTRFVEYLIETNKKLLSLNFRLMEGNVSVQFVLFTVFEVDPDNAMLKVSVNQPFAYLINDVTSNYTSLALEESVSLKTVYAKGIYKKLRKYKNTSTPFWKVSLDDFREYLDVPPSFKTAHIDTRILKPCIEELSLYFKDLKVEKYFESSGKVGRSKLDGYIFTFTSTTEEEAA